MIDQSMMVLAQASPPAAPAAGADLPASAGLIATVWDLAWKGGILMIPITICSLVALAIVVERLIMLKRSRVVPPLAIADVRQALNQGEEQAIERARSSNSSFGRIVESALRALPAGREASHEAAKQAAVRESMLLRTHLRGLSLIAAISPLLGLLGTIFGMIKAFRTVAQSGEALGRTELLAGGIYEAMVTTAAGLIVAIPAVIMGQVLASKVDSLMLALDTACRDVLSGVPGRVNRVPMSKESALTRNGTVAEPVGVPA